MMKSMNWRPWQGFPSPFLNLNSGTLLNDTWRKTWEVERDTQIDRQTCTKQEETREYGFFYLIMSKEVFFPSVLRENNITKKQKFDGVNVNFGEALILKRSNS